MPETMFAKALQKPSYERSVICAVIVIAFSFFFSRPAFAGQDLVIHYLPEQITIPVLAEIPLHEIIKSDDFFVIKVNKYDKKQSEKHCLARKYALVRALELRKFMIKNGVRLDKIKIIVTTNRYEETDIAIIDAHGST